MSKTLRIVCDIDGILADCNTAAHAVLSQHCVMKPLSVSGPSAWDWYDEHGATEIAQRELSNAMLTGKFWEDLTVHADVTDDTSTLLCELNYKHELTFVTARPGPRWATEQWLSRAGVTTPRVLHTPGPKLHALSAMRPDLIIEDNGMTLRDWAQFGYPCTNILVKRPYNQRYWNAPGLTLVNSTMEALSLALEVK